MNNNTLLAGIIVGGAALAAAGAIAFNSGYDPLQQYATVVSVAQAYETTQTPRVVCGDQKTLAQAAASPQSGAGSDMPASAAAPDEPAGPAVGDDAPPLCLTVFDTASVEAGFDVTYELDGVQRVVRLDRNPGSRIPVEDGELVLSRS